MLLYLRDQNRQLVAQNVEEKVDAPLAKAGVILIEKGIVSGIKMSSTGGLRSRLWPQSAFGFVTWAGRSLLLSVL